MPSLYTDAATLAQWPTAERLRALKRIIPRATILSVVGIGLFYVFVSWMAVAGTGPQHSIELAQDASTAGDIFFGPVRGYYGEWAVTMFSILLCTGSFACGMAFHNCASRYLLRLAARAFRSGCRRHSARRTPSTARRILRRWCRAESRW